MWCRRVERFGRTVAQNSVQPCDKSHIRRSSRVSVHVVSLSPTFSIHQPFTSPRLLYTPSSSTPRCPTRFRNTLTFRGSSSRRATRYGGTQATAKPLADMDSPQFINRCTKPTQTGETIDEAERYTRLTRFLRVPCYLQGRGYRIRRDGLHWVHRQADPHPDVRTLRVHTPNHLLTIALFVG